MRNLTGIDRNAPAMIAGLLIAAIVAAAWALVSAGGPASATHVEPTPISEGNPSCTDFAGGSGWSELKLEGDDLANGVYTDGTLEVTISSFVQSAGDTPGSFDWASNIGVDAVFVKAGNDKHNLYIYNPEATSDDGLGPQGGRGNGISHISFCYDIEETPTPTPTPSSTPTPSPTPSPTVLLATQTPDPTLTPAVAAAALPASGGTTGSGSSGLTLLLLLGGFAVIVGGALFAYGQRRSLNREL